MFEAVKITDKTFHLLESLATTSNLVPSIGLVYDYYLLVEKRAKGQFRWCIVAPELFREMFKFVEEEKPTELTAVETTFVSDRTLFS